MADAVLDPKPLELNIFLSHKSTDHAAGELKKLLESYGNGRLRVEMTNPTVKPGIDWREEIDRTLREADRFVLLFTDPSMNHDWGMFESGYFCGQSREQEWRKFHLVYAADRIGEDLIPSPLRPWNPVAVSPCSNVKHAPDSLKEFLRDIYQKPPRNDQAITAINPDLFDVSNQDDLNDILKELSQIVCEAGRLGPVKYFARHIRLEVPRQDLEKTCDDESLDDALSAAKIHLDERTAVDFRLSVTDEGLRWTDFASHLGFANEDWARSWTRRLVELISRSMPEVVDNENRNLPVLRIANRDFMPGVRLFRPTLYSAQETSEGAVEFKIVLTEIPSENDPFPRDECGALMHLAAISRSFHWGVIPRYLEALESADSDDQIRKLMRRLDNSIDDLIAESLNRGYAKTKALNAFEGHTSGRFVQDMFLTWDSNVEGGKYSSLRESIAARDVSSCLILLAELDVAHEKLHCACVKRLAELLSAETMAGE